MSMHNIQLSAFLVLASVIIITSVTVVAYKYHLRSSRENQQSTGMKIMTVGHVAASILQYRTTYRTH